MRDGAVVDAFSSGTMVRGFELILKGRDPATRGRSPSAPVGLHDRPRAGVGAGGRGRRRDHGAPNADLIRNLMFCAQYCRTTPSTSTTCTRSTGWTWSARSRPIEEDVGGGAVDLELAAQFPGYFSDLQKRLTAFVESGQLGIFANGYWGHPAYKLPPEVNLIGVAHYLEALEWQKEIVKVHTIFGGKNPHPNYLVGGVPCSINLHEVNAINAERLAMVGQLFEDAQRFVEQVYIPDLLAVAGFYKDWGAIGGGLENYLAFGDLPTNGFADVSSFKFPRGVIVGRKLDEVLPIDPQDPLEMQEFITHSWYAYGDGDLAGKHPWDGETTLNYTGPQPPYQQLEVEQKYSWLKTPRWKGLPMEVGPLARLLVAHASGHAEVREAIGDVLARLDVPLAALYSTLGRTAARGIETMLIARWARGFYQQLLDNIKAGDTRTADVSKWDPATWPAEARGVGLSEAPRGALSHWIVIRDGRIDNYQLVVPSTWNASPRDAQGQRSAYEASLIGTPVADTAQPLELLRTIHSFDPCIACAVHIHDPHGRHVHHLDTF